jgi:hypothetical protein
MAKYSYMPKEGLWNVEIYTANEMEPVAEYQNVKKDFAEKQTERSSLVYYVESWSGDDTMTNQDDEGDDFYV